MHRCDTILQSNVDQIFMNQGISQKAIRAVLREYWNQYKLQKGWTFLAFIFPALGNIFVFFVPPLVVSKIVTAYVANNGLSLTEAAPYLAAFAGLWLLGEVFWRIGMHSLIHLEAYAVNNLSKIGFRTLAERDYDFYTNNFVGSLSKKTVAFSRSFELFTDTLSFNVVANIFPFFFALVVLAQYSVIIPLLLVVCMLIIVLVALPIIRRRAKLVAARHDASSKSVGRLSDALTNMLAIKSFAKEQQELKTFGEYTTSYMKTFKKAADYHNLRLEMAIFPLYVATNVLGIVAALFFSQTLNLPAGVLVIIFSYYSQVTRVVWDINRIYRNIESAVGEATEFTEMFLDPAQITDLPRARHLKITRGQVSFSEVHFKYQEHQGKDSFLNNFTLDILANQKVGLVGPSGSGKTTLTRLLLRFVDVQGGAVLVDGQDIKKHTQKSLRDAISYVPQEPLLFHRSLFENIAYGDETATEKDVIRAAKLAHAHEFIATLPQGYQTMVGERGIKLSGGQRQRVAIARALLKKSRILILDEATSSLDSESEKYIQDGLEKLMANRTAIVIAHRLSTIKNMDRILVLDHGKIVQDGSHEELIKQKGLYAKLWSHQSGEFL